MLTTSESAREKQVVDASPITTWPWRLRSRLLAELSSIQLRSLCGFRHNATAFLASPQRQEYLQCPFCTDSSNPTAPSSVDEPTFAQSLAILSAPTELSIA